jgi:mannose-6-phosphate isomerase-like protein (cupin superfamily)
MSDRLQITPGETLEVVERTPDVLVLNASWSPGGSAPPAHYHPAQDEHFEVLEGALHVELDGAERLLRAGETLDIPRGTRHRMWNPDPAPARARWETRPAGRTEQWFAAVAALQGTEHVDAKGRPKPLPFAALAQKYGDTFRLAAAPEPVMRVVIGVLAGAARLTRRVPHSL